MADVKPDSIPNPDLRILIEGTDRIAFVKDRFGAEHKLYPITLSDILAYEKEVGKSLLESAGSLKVEEIAYLLFLSMRKDGLTTDEIKAKKFKLQKEDVFELFNVQFLRSAGPVYLELLRLAGLDIKEEKEDGAVNPPKAATESGQ